MIRISYQTEAEGSILCPFLHREKLLAVRVPEDLESTILDIIVDSEAQGYCYAAIRIMDLLEGRNYEL
jgi:hypothetical protein